MQNIKKIAHDYNLIKSKSDRVLEFTCRVKQLDEYAPMLEITVSRDSGGQWLLDEVCERLGSIQEKDYFGLRYLDKDKQRQWLDLGRNIYSQLKDTHPQTVSFRIKHFPASPLYDLKQSLARTYLYLQLRRDLFSGRLLGKSSDLYQLAAHAAQCENGEYDNENEDLTYISNLKVLPNLHAKTEAKIIDIHKKLGNMSRDEAERIFLEKACELDTYGVEPFYVKDQKGNNLYVGLTHEGVSTFQGSKRAHLFKWSDISKIHYQGKLFIVQVFLEERKHVLGFKCETTFTAAALWKWANDRMCFFSLNRSSEAKKIKSGGGIFKKRQTFKFAGRCQHEIVQMSASMMQINEHGSIGSRQTSILLRSDAVQDDFFIDDKPNFDTLPSRDRGTQNTLDSLFVFKDHVSEGNDANHSPINSSVGSPVTNKKSKLQSMKHVVEESVKVSHDSISDHIVASSTVMLEKNASQTSSTKSSSHNLTLNSDNSVKRKLSTSNGDIALALAQLNLAVSDAVTDEITKVVKRNNIGHYLVKFVCVSCVVLALMFLLTIFAALFMALVGHSRHDDGSYDYSGFFQDIVSRPRDFVRPSQVSVMARNWYFQFSKYLSPSSNEH